MPCIQHKRPDPFLNQVGDIACTGVFVGFYGEEERPLRLLLVFTIPSNRQLSAVGQQIVYRMTLAYSPANSMRTNGI